MGHKSDKNLKTWDTFFGTPGIEWAVDRMYQDINHRACVMTTTDIMISQDVLRANLEILHERKGRTLVSHVQGENVML